MKLAKDRQPGAFAVRIVCIECGKRPLLSDAWADLHGEPFRSYYCDACAEKYSEAPRFVDGESVDNSES